MVSFLRHSLHVVAKGGYVHAEPVQHKWQGLAQELSLLQRPSTGNPQFHLPTDGISPLKFSLWPSLLQCFSLATPWGLASSISPGSYQELQQMNNTRLDCGVGSVSKCPSRGCTGPQLVGGGWACTTKVFPEEAFQQCCACTGTQLMLTKNK